MQVFCMETSVFFLSSCLSYINPIITNVKGLDFHKSKSHLILNKCAVESVSRLAMSLREAYSRLVSPLLHLN
jgi:hypothetical protein